MLYLVLTYTVHTTFDIKSGFAIVTIFERIGFSNQIEVRLSGDESTATLICGGKDARRIKALDVD